MLARYARHGSGLGPSQPQAAWTRQRLRGGATCLPAAGAAVHDSRNEASRRVHGRTQSRPVVLPGTHNSQSTAVRSIARSVMATDASAEQEDTRAAAFEALAATAGVDMQLKLRASGPPRFSGLFTPKAAKRGQVLMHIPAAVCLVVDYVAGIRLPNDGSWPNLVALGLNSPRPVPWDLLLALALVDAEAGQGGKFWKDYIESVLPGEADLSLPFCLPESMLSQLQDSTVQFNAMAQKDRLSTEFPSLANLSEHDGLPPLLRFFACVRSRAFKASEDCFAFVPFLDAANHSDAPNADFRCTEEGDWQLVAVKDIAEGDEVCISYTGEPGYANRRLMAQYGFVPMGGNSAERLDLEEDLGLSVNELGGAQLSGTRMQAAVGETAFVDMLAGRNMYLYQAIRSLPMKDDEADQSVSTGGADVKLAEAVLQAVQKTLEGYPTTLAEDEADLQDILADRERDTRLLSVVTYRMEKKKLLGCMQDIMDKYLKVAT